MSKALLAHTLRWETILLFLSLVVANVSMFAMGSLGDYQVSFYKSAQYLLHGDNIYTSPYPHPTLGREYPPFNPVWAIHTIIPISVFPLKQAVSLRYGIDLVMIPFVIYLCARMVHLNTHWVFIFVVAAPWHFITLYSGQWTTLVFLGMLLCYYGVHRRHAPLVAIGIWLAMIKVNLTLPIILVTLWLVWRNEMFSKTIKWLVVLVTIFSLAQPLWFYDLLMLYYNRLQTPRLADSVLLLPGYPWSQLILLVSGIVFASWYLARTHMLKPEPWFWALLIALGLVSALHTFTYDWLILALPIIWLLHDNVRRIWWLALLYVYPFIWMMVLRALGVSIHSAFFTPGEFMMLVVWSILAPGFVGLALGQRMRAVLTVYVLLVGMMITLVLVQPALSPAFIPGVVLLVLVVTLWRQGVLWGKVVYAKRME